VRRLFIKYTLTAVLLLCCTIFINAEERSSVAAIRKADKSISIDGKLDDSIWQNAKWYSNFTLLKSGEQPAAQTKFAVAYDDAKIYFAIRCEENAMDKIKANANKRDGNVWQDDGIEVMLLPLNYVHADKAFVAYPHFALNSENVQYDGMTGIDGVKWDAQWKSGVYKGDDFWSVELAIPFAVLNIEADTGKQWLFNVVRARKAGTKELSSFSSLKGIAKFDAPDKFSFLNGLDVNFKKFLFEVVGFDVLLKGEKSSIKANIINNSDVAGKIKINAMVLSDAGGDIEKSTVTTKPGSDHSVLLGNFDLKKGGICTFYLTVKDDNGMLLRQMQMTKEITYSLFKVKLIEPFYRQSIYYTEKLNAIKLEATVNLGDGVLAKSKLTARLLNSNGEIFPGAQISVTPSAPVVELEIPITDIKPGKYKLQVTLTRGDNNKEITENSTITVLPKAPGSEVRVDADLNLLVDGKLYFPWGFYGAGWRVNYHTYLAKYGFNTMQSYGMGYHNIKAARKYLDIIDAAGMKILFSAFPLNDIGQIRAKSLKELTPAQFKMIETWVNGLKDHPAILGWFLFDEPRTDDLRRMAKQVYHQVRELDPYHPCIGVDNKYKLALKIQDACDILQIDPYPGFKEPGGSDYLVKPIRWTGDHIAATRKGLTTIKPVWLCVQTFAYGDFFNDRKLGRAPTYTEERCMIYQGIIEGAKAVLGWKIGSPNWDGPYWRARKDERRGLCGVYSKRNTSLRVGLFEGLSAEIKDLSPIFMLPDSEKEVKSNNSNVLTMLKEKGDYFYLFTVNNTKTPLGTITITVDGLQLPELKVICEGRNIKVNNGVIKDEFAEFAVHVYSNDPSFDKLKTLSEVQTLIDDAIKRGDDGSDDCEQFEEIR
jgi:hypothetical protein